MQLDVRDIRDPVEEGEVPEAPAPAIEAPAPAMEPVPVDEVLEAPEHDDVPGVPEHEKPGYWM